jgi:hypothetical protein
VLGPGRYDGGRGTVGGGDHTETWSVSHADGTSVEFNPYVGDDVGLWTYVGDVGIATSWWAPTPAPTEASLVSECTYDPETGISSGKYGTSAGYYDTYRGTNMSLEPLEPGAIWSARGSVWVQAVEGGSPIYTVLHADGSLVRIDPNRERVLSQHDGPYKPLSAVLAAAGMWQPTEDGGFAFTIQYRDHDPSGATQTVGQATLKGQGVFADDGESMTAEYRSTWTSDSSSVKPVETTGTATATRLHLVPLTGN